MAEVTIRYNNKKVLNLLKDFSKYFEMEIIEKKEKKNAKPRKGKLKISKVEIPIQYAEKPDFMAAAGIWKNNPMTIEELRQKAWGNRR